MANLLSQLLVRIDDDIARNPVPFACEIYLGDLVDRGPASADVLRLLVERRRRRNVICIAGNHEIYVLQALKDRSAFKSWLEFGGRETLISYGIQPPQGNRKDTAFSSFAAALLGEPLSLLQNLLPMYRFGDYLFVHAGIRPGLSLVQQQITDLTTIRGPFLESTTFHGVVVVHGHTPVSEVDIHPNRINIDTGAYMSGRLSCLVIEDNRLRLV